MKGKGMRHCVFAGGGGVGKIIGGLENFGSRAPRLEWCEEVGGVRVEKPHLIVAQDGGPVVYSVNISIF